MKWQHYNSTSIKYHNILAGGRRNIWIFLQNSSLKSHLKANTSCITVVPQDNKRALEVVGVTFGVCWNIIFLYSRITMSIGNHYLTFWDNRVVSLSDQTVIVLGHFSPWRWGHSLSWNIDNWLLSGMASYPRRMESSATLLQKSTRFIDIFSHTSEEMCTEGLVRICEGNRPLGKPRNRCNINKDL